MHSHQPMLSTLLDAPSTLNYGLSQPSVFSYQFSAYQATHQQTLAFPKEVLRDGLSSILEFSEQRQLYYYLTWTCKMQLIDQQFLHYSLRHDTKVRQLAIFNSELHFASDHASEVYIVAVLNNAPATSYKKGKPRAKFTMLPNGFMTAKQIHHTYGIQSSDLPKGSRSLHRQFQQHMDYNQSLLSDFKASGVIPSWRYVDMVYSQKFNKREIPQFFDNELNKALKQALNEERLELIPILNIDTHMNEIRCQSLVPMRVGDRWVCASFEQCRAGVVIDALFIDVADIIQKASLVHPSGIRKYQWLTGEVKDDDTSSQRSQKSDFLEETVVNLQKQLNEAFKINFQLLKTIEAQSKTVNDLKQSILIKDAIIANMTPPSGLVLNHGFNVNL